MFSNRKERMELLEALVVRDEDITNCQFQQVYVLNFSALYPSSPKLLKKNIERNNIYIFTFIIIIVHNHKYINILLLTFPFSLLIFVGSRGFTCCGGVKTRFWTWKSQTAWKSIYANLWLLLLIFMAQNKINIFSLGLHYPWHKVRWVI